KSNGKTQTQNPVESSALGVFLSITVVIDDLLKAIQHGIQLLIMYIENPREGRAWLDAKNETGIVLTVLLQKYAGVGKGRRKVYAFFWHVTVNSAADVRIAKRGIASGLRDKCNDPLRKQ